MAKLTIYSALLKKLRSIGVNPEHILYINFEDERLDLTRQELNLLLQTYQELYPNIKLSDCYFLFDEVQEVIGWEKFIARLHSTISHHIFITGSNAKLLSREIATALRGKTLTYEIYPLSFREFADLTEPSINPNSSQGKAKLTSLFDKFLIQGGFPELITLDSSLHRRTLQEYFNVMVLRDLVERYRISQVTIFKYFCKRVVGNSATEFSTNKLFRELKSQGYKISKDTIYSFQDYAESAYLARLITKHSPSTVKRELSGKKSYVIDHGLGSALDFKLSQDKGRLLETAVALELIKQGRDIAYTQNGYECDFVVSDRGKIVNAMQVTYDISSPKTKKREVDGLIKVCQTYHLDRGTIITMDNRDSLKQNNISVEIIPAWQYFYQT